MALTLTAVAEPSHVPPRVRLEAEESDPTFSIDSCAFFRDGSPLRFSATITDQLALAYDYDAPLDVAMQYRADTVETGVVAEWTEPWPNTGFWTGSGWTVAAGVASTVDYSAAITRSAHPGRVTIAAPADLIVELLDATNAVLVSCTLSLGSVILTGTTTQTVTGSGAFTLAVAGSSVSVAGTGWSATVSMAGTPTQIRLRPAPVSKAAFGPALSYGNKAVAVDSSGNVYRWVYSDKTIRKYNSAGTQIASWATLMTDCQHMCLDSSGNIFLAGDSAIRKFNSSGTQTATWTTTEYAHSVAVDGSGNVYVATTHDFELGPEDIRKYNSSGVQQAIWDPNSYFSQFAVDSAGNVYTSSWAPKLVRKFTSTGTPITTWTTTDYPLGVLLGPSGDVYVLTEGGAIGEYGDGTDHKLRRYSTTGTVLGVWSMPYEHWYYHFVLVPAGNYLIAPAYGDMSKYYLPAASVDDIAVSQPSSTIAVSALDTETLAGVGIWLTNTVNPDLALQIDDCGNPAVEFALGENTRKTTRNASTSVGLKIEGSSKTLSVSTGPREEAEWTLEIICKTESARKALEALLADNAPVSLRIAADHANLGLDGGFYAVGDTSSDREQVPVISELTTVPLPLTPTFAPAFDSLWQWNWDALAQTGLTWDEVAVLFPTWNDLLIGPVA